MGFAERHGFVEQKHIQIDDIDSTLRNRLYNAVHKYLEPSPFIHDELKYVVDKLGCRVEGTTQKNWSKVDFYLEKSISDVPWYMPYEIIEIFFEAKREYCKKCTYDCHERGGTCGEMIWLREVPKVINAQFVQNVKKSVNDKTWQFTKDEILAALQNISENTLWDKLIGENAVPSLRTYFVKVKDFRNDIMHAHSMSSSSFSSALKLIKRINEQLDVEIGQIIVEKETTPEAQSDEDFNAAMSDAIRDMDAAKQAKSWQEQLAEIQTTVSAMKGTGMIAALEEYRRLAASSEFAAIQQQMKEMSKIQVDIPPAIKELQAIAASMEQYKITLPPAVLELQKTLQAFKPDPAITELAKTLRDITGERN